MDEAVEAASLLDPACRRAALLVDTLGTLAGVLADLELMPLALDFQRRAHEAAQSAPRPTPACWSRATATRTSSSPRAATRLGELCAELGEGLLDDGRARVGRPALRRGPRAGRGGAAAAAPRGRPAVVAAQVVHGWALVGLGEHAAAAGPLRAAVRITCAAGDRAQLRRRAARAGPGPAPPGRRPRRRRAPGLGPGPGHRARPAPAAAGRAARAVHAARRARRRRPGAALPAGLPRRRAGPGRRAAHPLGGAVRPAQEPAGDRARRRSAAPPGLRGPADPPAQPPLRRGAAGRPARRRRQPRPRRRRRRPVQVDQRRDRPPRRRRRAADRRRPAHRRRAATPTRCAGGPATSSSSCCPSTTAEQAERALERIRREVAGYDWAALGPEPAGDDQRRHRLGRPRRRPAHPLRRRRRRALRRQAQRPRPRRAAVRGHPEARRRQPAGRAVRRLRAAPAARRRRSPRRRHPSRRPPARPPPTTTASPRCWSRPRPTRPLGVDRPGEPLPARCPAQRRRRRRVPPARPPAARAGGRLGDRAQHRAGAGPGPRGAPRAPRPARGRAAGDARRRWSRWPPSTTRTRPSTPPRWPPPSARCPSPSAGSPCSPPAAATPRSPPRPRSPRASPAPRRAGRRRRRQPDAAACSPTRRVLADADCLVVVAGLDAALAGAGRRYTDVPVVAVPTSAGQPGVLRRPRRAADDAQLVHAGRRGDQHRQRPGGRRLRRPRSPAAPAR